MKRLTKILLGFICACTMLFGGGCSLSNQMDEIFQGNYVEVSEETVRDFVAKTKKVTEYQALRELVNNNGGVSVFSSIKVLGIGATVKGNVLRHIDGTYRYRFDTKSIINIVAGGTRLVYSNGKYCYTYKDNAKTVHSCTNDCITSCTVTLGVVVLADTVDNDKWEQVESWQYFMDSTSSNYMKVKVIGIPKNGITKMECIWIYDTEYRWIAHYMTTYAGAMTWQIIPWSGTITPPDDLDSYVFEDK